MSKQLINQYYNQRDNLKRVGVTNEMAIKQPFDSLLLNLASAKHYVYATEVTIKNESGKNIRPDGILMTELRIHKGYVESKDTNDTLDQEINKKLYYFLNCNIKTPNLCQLTTIQLISMTPKLQRYKPL